MKILIDIGHPAHVHYFKNFIRIMESKGHHIVITARDKDVSLSLLDEYHLSYISRGKGKKAATAKLIYMFQADGILLSVSKREKPDIFLSFGSPYAAQVAWLRRKPHIVFDDTEHAKAAQILYYPFTSVVLNPSCYRSVKKKKQILFNGFMELCYLHPNRFTPDASILRDVSIHPDEKYCMIRFVSWEARHDAGLSGFSFENKIKIVQELSKKSRVIISSENELPAEIESFRYKISPGKMHHLLAFASLLVGESATMASEAAVLGVPAVYVDEIGRGYTDEEEKRYGLVFNYKSTEAEQKKAIAKSLELVDLENKKEFEEKRHRLLKEKIDVTAFMVWFVEKYPDSVKILRENPEWQMEFQ